MVIAVCLAIVSESGDSVDDVRALLGDRTTNTECSEVFRGVKTKRPEGPKLPTMEPTVPRAVGLGAILD
jgi:hypothetical protein